MSTEEQHKRILLQDAERVRSLILELDAAVDRAENELYARLNEGMPSAEIEQVFCDLVASWVQDRRATKDSETTSICD